MQLVANGTQGGTSVPAKQAPIGTPGYCPSGLPGTFTEAILDPDLLNTVLAELATPVLASGQALDPTNNGQLLIAIRGMSGAVAGAARNLKMSVTSASATATLTADEIVVETALAGLPFRLGSFSKSVNLGTVGAGGMDVGSAPVSGYVALYAIFYPATSTAALLAVNATSAAAPSVYGGSNMPSGYTASALVSVWPTNGSGQFVVGFQSGRRINIAPATALNTTSQTVLTALSISGIVPPNAIAVRGFMSGVSTAASAGTLSVAITSAAVGTVACGFGVAPNEGTSSSFVLDVGTTQQIYYSMVSTAGTPTVLIVISGYDI